MIDSVVLHRERAGKRRPLVISRTENVGRITLADRGRWASYSHCELVRFNNFRHAVTVARVRVSGRDMKETAVKVGWVWRVWCRESVAALDLVRLRDPAGEAM